jgi:hypothetical protein
MIFKEPKYSPLEVRDANMWWSDLTSYAEVEQEYGLDFSEDRKKSYIAQQREQARKWKR